MPHIIEALARELGVSPAQAEAVVALIDDGNTIPFIARYRKEATGGMDDATLRAFDERLAYLRNLEARKAETIAAIEAATVMQRVEDLYKPFKKKRATRASKARAAGLEPLANLVLAQATNVKSSLDAAAGYVNAEGGYPDAEAALQGACDIVAETIADDPEHTAALRAFTHKTARFETVATDASEKTPYKTYYDFSEPARRIPNHRVLAIDRGEKEGKLRVRMRTDADTAIDLLGRRIVRRRGPFAESLDAAITDGYKRLMAPSL